MRNYQLWIFLLLFLNLGIFHISCTIDRWQRRSEEIFYKVGGSNTCRLRAELLSKEMQKAGVPHYIVTGTYRGKPHMWIVRESDLHILDPNVYGYNKTQYKELWGRKII